MKVIIIGNGGTGKSTLGAQLSEQLKVPVYHLDQYTMKAGWERVPEEEFTAQLKAILETDEWIVEGWAYDSTVQMRIDAADTILHLDYPMWFCWWNAFKRHLQYTFRPNPYDPPNSWIWDKTTKMIRAMKAVDRVYEPRLREMLANYRGNARIFVLPSRRALRKQLPQIFPQLQG